MGAQPSTHSNGHAKLLTKSIRVDYLKYRTGSWPRNSIIASSIFSEQRHLVWNLNGTSLRKWKKLH